MRPYTMDLRERVAAAVDDGLWSQRQIAGLFRVGVSFVTRLLSRRRETGTLAPDPHRGGPTRVLSIAQKCRLWDLVEEHGDYTLEELRQAGGFDCCLTTIWRPLRRHGLTRKKKSMHAECAIAPTSCGSGGRSGIGCGGSSPGGCISSTSRGRVRRWPEPTPGRRGERAVGSAPGQWKSFTMIAALGLDGRMPRW